jgi:porphobilinogen synthase
LTSNSIGHNSPLKASNLITPIIIGKYTSTRKSDLQVMSDRKLTDRLEKILSLQMNKVIIFGTPKVHNSLGSEAWNNKGIVQNTIKNIKSNFDKKLQVIADVCVCQYNLSGHCGIINYQNNQVDNDKTLKFMSKISLSYAESGADTVAPSSMMDGLVLSIRNNLNNNGYRATKIMSFSKQHSCLYSPFRLTAFKKFSNIDKSTYQIGYSNAREMMRKIELDFREGADIITIKPSMSNLDLISRIIERVNCRIAVQHVSGEFAMLKAATRHKLIEEHEWLIGYFSSMIRAGANQIISYGAEEIAALI